MAYQYAMEEQYLVQPAQDKIPLSFKFAIGTLVGAAIVVVGLFVNEAQAATSLFVAPAVTATRPVAMGVTARVPMLSQAAEEAIEEAAVVAALEEESKQISEKERLGIDGQDTYYPKLADTLAVNKDWYVIDAEGLRLGRMATEIARILRGKNKATFHPAMDMGDYVIVINADKVAVSGNKGAQKLYRRHPTGRPGSMKVETFDELQARIPERIVEQAVKGMLPKGALGRQLYRHMKVFAGSEHPHGAQNPIEFKFEGKLAKAAEPVKRGR